MKITDYPKATSLAPGDAFIIDNEENGTRYIEQEDLPWGEGGGSVPETDPEWVSHRNTYRGKSLGSVYTDEQKEAISSQTFDDLYIGDYWTIGNVDWLIADINYWLDSGDNINTQCTTPHLVVVPRKNLYSAKMYDTRVTTGGYVGSKMYTSNLNQAKTIIYTAFGENNILNHRASFCNSVKNNTPAGNIWVDSKVDLMNQLMVAGSFTLQPVGLSASSVIYTTNQNQLSLFALCPDLIDSKSDTYWLSDIINDTMFCNINNLNNGLSANYSDATLGVRPAFGLTGGTN